MKTNQENRIDLFIVDQDPIVSLKLQSYLESHFDKLLHISSFRYLKDAIQAVNKSTEIVIIKTYFSKINNLEIEMLKKINKKVQIIQFQSKYLVEKQIVKYMNNPSVKLKFLSKYKPPRLKFISLKSPFKRKQTKDLAFFVYISICKLPQKLDSLKM